MELANFIKFSIVFFFLIVLLRITINSLFQFHQKLNFIVDEKEIRTFSIDFKHNTFLKDNKSFRYISGSVFYARIPELYWYDRLLKIKAAGLNAIQFYVPWNFHEYEEGQYNFVGNANLNKFLKIARQLDLLVLLRIGPYICAEWDFGGLPAWLLRKNDKMILRSSEPDYLQAVLKWYSVLLPKLKTHLYQNNGSIIMVQIENEYGYYYTCDNKYLRVLYDTVRSYLGDDIIIYSTDGNGYSYFPCGSSDRRIFTTVDFGASESINPEKAFSELKRWQPHGPLVNSECYFGWYDAWGGNHNVVKTPVVLKALVALYNYSNSVNFNMYLFHGGTTFGFWNGANNSPYLSQTTSYDFDAPLSEAGDTTEKYMAIRNYLKSINPEKPFLPVPPNTTKAAYGIVKMQQNIDYFKKLISQYAFISEYPLTMESLAHYHGYMIYLTRTSNFILSNWTNEDAQIKFSRIGDYAYIFTSNADHTNIKFFGILNRNMKDLLIKITVDVHLVILMENAGHVDFGGSIFNDVKGIIGNVTLNGKLLVKWKHFPINLTDYNSILKIIANRTINAPSQSGLFLSLFHLPSSPQDTFLKLTDFSKGAVLINGFNLGRYWNTKGPQYTLFVPKSILNFGWNKIILFELEGTNCTGNCFIEFFDRPIFNNNNNNLQSSI